MYDFMHVVPDIMSDKDYFSDTKTFAKNYKKISTLGPVPKYWLGFSDIRS